MKKYKLGLYEKSMPADLTWREKLQAAKAAGYDFIEMSIDETEAKLKRLEMSERECAQLMTCSLEEGIPIGSICLSAQRRFPLGEANADKSLEIVYQAICLASRLGVRIIQLAGYDVYYQESSRATRERFDSNLPVAVEMAAGMGIVLAFETMETAFMDTVQKAMIYIEKINSPYLQIYPDSGNITNSSFLYSQDVSEDIKTGRHHIVAFHLKEARPGQYREIPYGQGCVDLKKITAAAWGAGVRRYVAEFWYREGEDWRENLEKNRMLLSGYLEACEVKKANEQCCY